MAEIIEIVGTGDLERDLNRLPEAFSVIHAKYSQALAGGWKQSIIGVDALDTYRYLFSVAAHAATGSVDTKEFLIDTSNDKSVNYSDIVEQGRRPGGKPPNENHPGYAGRHPVQKSLDAQDSADLLDQITQQALSEFLHG